MLKSLTNRSLRWIAKDRRVTRIDACQISISGGAVRAWEGGKPLRQKDASGLQQDRLSHGGDSYLSQRPDPQRPAWPPPSRQLRETTVPGSRRRAASPGYMENRTPSWWVTSSTNTRVYHSVDFASLWPISIWFTFCGTWCYTRCMANESGRHRPDEKRHTVSRGGRNRL